MRIEVFTDIEQNTPEWFKCRSGIPTASCFDKVLAQGRGQQESRTRLGYLHQLVDEQLYNDPVETYTNEHMERGKLWEAEARDIYALEWDIIPERVGFIKNHTIKAGCSPDALLGKTGALEIKTMLPKLVIPYILKGGYPPEYTAQLQGILWVTEREWIDLAIYWPKRPLHVARVHRDEPYIANLARAVGVFNSELDNIVAAIRTKRDLRGTLEASA